MLSYYFLAFLFARAAFAGGGWLAPGPRSLLLLAGAKLMANLQSRRAYISGAYFKDNSALPPRSEGEPFS